jgi:23S rRNA (cytidine1920-2'-O)/16S rRNA (cytidine1409-2'-O)-methyltransferase
VRLLERTNIRRLDLDTAGGRPFPVVVADLSFISLRTVAPTLLGELAAVDAQVVVLVKPQFEAGRAEVSRGRGVVRDPTVWLRAVEGVASAFVDAGAAIMGAMVSPLTGADGNVEFLLHAVAHAERPQAVDLAAVVTSASVGAD